jgi:hypothetical protein
VTTALVAALSAEALLLGCAAAAWILHRVRRRRLEERFATAQAEARQLVLDARIVDASVAERSELVLEEALRELGLDISPLAPPPPASDPPG